MRAFALVAGLAAGGALFARSTPSLADDTPSSAPPAVDATPRGRPLVWYGWQTLLVDAAMTGGFFAVDSGAFRTFLGGAYLASGPIIHAAHDQGAVAVLSIAVRLFLPLVGASVGASTATCNGAQEAAAEQNGDFHSCSTVPLLGAIAGAGVGALSAMVVDAAMSWERAPPPDSATGRPVSTSWLLPVLSPTVGSDRRPGLSLGVEGVF
jgi:hypothetical protein